MSRPIAASTIFCAPWGAVPAIQLGHAGAQASTRGAMQGWAPLTDDDRATGRPPWRTIGPTTTPYGPGHAAPDALDGDDIRHVIAAFAEAARRAVAAGFDVCEIHGAHGYLIHQFLSPAANTRNDGYGGDLAGRMRFALELTEAVRAAWPADRPLFFRVSSIDGRGGAWSLADTVVLARALAARGVDVIDCSAGGIGGSSALPALPRVPGYHVAYSSEVRREAQVATVAVGLITTGAQAEALLQEGHADLIALARELMLDPNWPVRTARAMGLADALALLPDSDAFRLRGRDAQAALYPVGCDAAIPVAIDRSLPYSWERRRPLLEREMSPGPDTTT